MNTYSGTRKFRATLSRHWDDTQKMEGTCTSFRDAVEQAVDAYVFAYGYSPEKMNIKIL